MKTRHRFALRALVSLALAATGCGSSSSDPVLSEDLVIDALRLDATARSNGSTAQVVVSVRDTMGQAVTLSGADRLLFSEAGGAEVALVVLDALSYVAQLETQATDFTLALERAGGERSEDAIALPPPFGIVTPIVEAPRSTPIPIVWDADGTSYQTQLEVDGPCLSTSLVRSLSPDPGSFTIQPADLFVAPGTVACDLDVTLTRSILANTGTFTATTQQIRGATIATVP